MTMMMTMTTITVAALKPKSIRLKIPNLPNSLNSRRIFMSLSLPNPSSVVDQFDPTIPIERAVTPPSSWYTDPSFYAQELDSVFYRGWQAVGYTEHVKQPGDFFTGRLGNVEFVVCRDENGKLQGFHNVCRHHASLLAYGTGRKSCFVCPYHGWTYGLDGGLLKATRITGIQNFDKHEFGLVPVKVATWGPFVLANMEKNVESDVGIVENEWLGSSSDILQNNGVDLSLSYVCRREYTIQCNWKVFCDNYLDGGYHVPYAHKDLASGLKFDSYSTTVYEKVSIQRCEGGSAEKKNEYGLWMDTNLVIPLEPRKCQVIFDYFLEASVKGDRDYVEKSLKESDKVQMEDVMLCEGVQRGLESPAYNIGRYAPTVENAMHHFHCLLHENLRK